MIQRHTITVAAVAVLLVVTATAPAAAAEESFFGGVVADDGDDGYLNVPDVARSLAEVSGTVARQIATLPVVGDETDGTASTYAQDFTDSFNQNNRTIQEYANKRLDADTDHDVFVVYFNDRDGNNVSRYVVSNASSGSWSNARVVKTTNRTVDHWISADWYASRHADEELEHFVDEYAEPGKNVTQAYRARMLAKYGSGLNSSLWS